MTLEDPYASHELNESSSSSRPITHHWELEVYRIAMDLSTQLFQESRHWPLEEKFSLIDQIRRSSRSVTAQIAEGWRKRRYRAAFISKLNDAEGEAAESKTWIEHAVRCAYLHRERGLALHSRYNDVIGKLVVMQNNPEPWLLPGQRD